MPARTSDADNVSKSDACDGGMKMGGLPLRSLPDLHGVPSSPLACGQDVVPGESGQSGNPDHRLGHVLPRNFVYTFVVVISMSHALRFDRLLSCRTPP
jgi:hypothetical protein